MKIKPIILAGGSGTRLWPLSRKNYPKPYISLIGNKTLLEITLERVMLVNFFTKPIIVCNEKHKFIVKDTLKKLNFEATIMLEPEGRGTAAVFYIASLLSRDDENLLFMPSDHILEENIFTKHLFSIITKPELQDNWILFGIKPSSASSEYGYIEVNLNREKLKNKNSSTLYDVTAFIEKPAPKIANQYYNNECYFWNSGMFLGNCNMINNDFKKKSPDLSNLCDLVLEHSLFNEKDNEILLDRNFFLKISINSIDYEIIENSENLKVILLDTAWSDVGSWDSLSKITKTDRSKNILSVDSKNNFIKSSKRIIATIDINNSIIIDTPDATLISKKGSAHKVHKVLKKIKKKTSVLKDDHIFENRPWGNFEILHESNACKVKKLEIKPFQRISLQYHNFRSEHWLIIKGNAEIHIDGNILRLKKGDSIDIPKKKNHYIRNYTNKALIVIETQLGTYFGEDDIIRLDDPHQR